MLDTCIMQKNRASFPEVKLRYTNPAFASFFIDNNMAAVTSYKPRTDNTP